MPSESAAGMAAAASEGGQARQWSCEEVKHLLAREDFRYQNIALPYGLSTGGKDRSATAARIFPDDLQGRSVLDIGSKYGYFCFEALRRGAGHVVGLDVDPECVRKANLLADCLGLAPTFRLADFETEPPEERFDYVLCLNVLHHFQDPIAALERMSALARERLVLEVAGLGWRDSRKLPLSMLSRLVLNRQPVMYVSGEQRGGIRSAQKFFITAPALRNLLVHHRSGFARVETGPTDHKRRYLAVAHKRRFARLVVVAAPSGTGKSALVGRLRCGELPELAGALGIGAPDGWAYASSGNIMHFTEAAERLVYQYNLLHPTMSTAKVYARDRVLDVLDAAEDVTVATLWCPPDLLGERYRTFKANKRRLLRPRQAKRQRRRSKKQREYTDPARVCAHYRRWLEFVREKGLKNVVISTEGEPSLHTTAELERWLSRTEDAA